MHCRSPSNGMPIHSADIERVKAEARRIANSDPTNAPFLDEDGDATWRPVVLCDHIKRVDFEGDLPRDVIASVFVEIASKNESLKYLREKLQRWMSLPTTQVAIKVFVSSERRVWIIHVLDVDDVDAIHSREVEFGRDAIL
ncbi:hypothetical protein FI667_g3129, partial [Globisporangium splendens]